MEIKRKKTRSITMGGLAIGGDAPVSVQSMTNTDTRNVEATVAQIERLAAAGCEIARVAVPDMEAARAVAEIRKRTALPLVADIHFDHRLAIAAAENGADGLRINPGNIGSLDRVKKVVDAAREHGLAIRVGVNAGSLEKELLAKHGGPTAEAMVESAVNHIRAIEDMGFVNLKASIKASDVLKTVEAYEKLSEKTDVPLHLGITEAGFGNAGVAKSAAGLGILLSRGLGDTLRVSLTGDPVAEIGVAYAVLRSLKIRERGPEIISCPTCGRTEIDVLGIAQKVEAELQNMARPLTIAVMGCVVNGPGEAKEADIGIAGGRGTGILFKKGNVVAKFPESELVERLTQAAREWENSE